MGMVVQHNMNALTAYNKLNANVAGLKKSSEKLASGYRINRAGDDAAGLAISEKMRSQIKGLNQAIRNSQDGINMVQTFEGAAQETHSILQRMKELATESANGTYDNPTDRAAIQLEFDQLNDELNQIADTDFNGTVVLNGGVMADGTVAKNGEFNYANNYTEVSVANKAIDISGEKLEKDLIVDQTLYNKSKADAVWNAVGVDVKDHEKLSVTFMYDGDRWIADTVTDKDGNVIKDARAAGLTAKEITDVGGNTGEGGFMIVAGKDEDGKDIDVAEAIFDEMKIATSDGARGVQEGDTVTIEFSNSKAITYAPQNAGILEDTIITPKLADDQTFTSGEVRGNLGFTLDTSVTDGNMTNTMQKILDDAKTLKFTATYDGGKKNAIEIDDDDASGDYTFAVSDKGVLTATDAAAGKTYTIGTIKTADFKGHTDAQAEKWDAITTATGVVEFDGADATAKAASETKFKAKLRESLAANNVVAKDFGSTDVAVKVKTIGTNAAGDVLQVAYTGKDADGKDVDVTVDIEAAAFADWGLAVTHGNATTGIASKAEGDELFSVTYTAETSATDELDATQKGTVDFKLDFAAYNYADMDELEIHAKPTPAVATMKAQVTTTGVTSANAFKNSTARMTYTDNITLQTGARTKDAVNFNFNYNVDGSADMGSLKANLNLSSRANGLNTANLSLANQDDANYAIDQIDKAINKTSMVRATFGSIQNRLEHKITNLTTTAENLTEAESSIRDTDMASEMMNYTKFNILQQAAQSMLAQANQQPQSILQLLG